MITNNMLAVSGINCTNYVTNNVTIENEERTCNHLEPFMPSEEILHPMWCFEVSKAAAANFLQVPQTALVQSVSMTLVDE